MVDKADQKAGEQSTPQTYRLEDWLADLSWYFPMHGRLIKSQSYASLSQELSNYFLKKYGSRASFHQKRLCAALRYAERHIESFNEGKIAIVGSEQVAFGLPLATALYRMYLACPDDRVNEDFPVEVILESAREMERAFARHKKK
jgi:hypothetical protein